MLKNILFLLSGDYERTADKHREEVIGKLKQAGVQAEFIIMTSKGTDGLEGSGASGKTAGLEEAAGPAGLGGLEGIDREHTLIVTDTAFIFDNMHEKGCYVIAFYHDGNREEIFAGAKYAVEDLPAVEYSSYQKAFKRLAGIPWDILETERMTVRETIPEDVDDFYRIYRNPSITRYMEDLFPDRDKELEYLKSYVEQIYSFYGFGLWTVIHKESGQVIGRAGLNVRDGYDIPELGFVIDAAYQRQGYAFEVCSAILKYAGEELDFPRVQAFVDGGNRTSIHLLERLGFAFDSEVELGRHYHRYIRSRKVNLGK